MVRNADPTSAYIGDPLHIAPDLNSRPESRTIPCMAYELGILGAGNMAEAIVRGLLSRQQMEASQIIASDLHQARRDLFQKTMGVKATADNREVAGQSANLLLSVKPQQMKALLEQVADSVGDGTLVISIAAGIPASVIEKHLGAQRPIRVVRTMPNTPLLVGSGVVAIAAGKHATEADLERVKQLFAPMAAVLVLDESKMDAVTAVSGSGPAYFFFLVEQMIAAGVSLGLTQEEAHLLATWTCQGAGRMLTIGSDSPAELRRKVTSPGGTTQAAMESMASKGVPEALVDAVRRAAERSKELAG